ncbi:MAG: DUF3426 domain-containing protein [Pseudomonadota bacterium]
MYTQCPECEAAFRVTAEVLKQAAGMVRCGSCGHAFNSLAYLSEQKPEPKIPDPAIPELRPEPAEQQPPSAAEPSPGPKAISAEQSAALLKTLDQLAGEDIRIEDTGVEWRVLDEKEVDEEPLDGSEERDILSDPGVTNAFRTEDPVPDVAAADDTDLSLGDVFEPGATIVEEQGVFGDHNTLVDELLDEAPTPVDEFLAADPNDGEAGEAVDHDLGALLDDLDAVDENEIKAELDALPDAAALVDSDIELPADAHVDAETDPLDSENTDEDTGVDAKASEDDDQAEAEEAEVVEPVLRFDDNTPLPDDFLDEEVPLAAAPVEEPAAVDVPDPEALQKDLELGKADEWQALLDEFGDLLATDLGTTEDDSEDTSTDDDWGELSEDAVDEELSRELELLEVDADADSESEVAESVENDAEPEADNDGAAALDDNDIEAPAADDAAPAIALAHDEAHDDLPANDDALPSDVEAAQDDDQLEVAEVVAEATPDDAERHIGEELYDGEPLPVDDDGGLDLTGILDPDNDGLEDRGESDAAPDDEGMPDIIDVGDGPEEQSVDEPGPGHPHYVPPPSEEEQTINMIIDQDLLAIAHEDDEGFTSTIVFEEGAEPTDVDSIIIGSDEDDRPANDDAPEDDAEHAELDADHDSPIDTPEAVAAAVSERRAPQNPGRTIGLGVLAAALLLALGAQSVHQKREQLATDPRFGNILQSLYGALGMPITPEWDVSGWRIEKAQGLTDDSGRLLTIFAQLGNQAEQPLPYPVITVSISDRYQESLGSVVVDPADYLGNNNVAADTVSGGDTFEATIPIAELSPNAEGYQLNACYRQPSGPLRCVKQDFR